MASGSLTTCPTPRPSSMNRAATSLIPTSSRNDSAGSSSRSDALYAAPLRMTEAATPAHDWRAPVMLLCLSSSDWRVLEEPVEVAGEVALEAAVCFASGLAFLEASFDVGDRRGV